MILCFLIKALKMNSRVSISSIVTGNAIKETIDIANKYANKSYPLDMF